MKDRRINEVECIQGDALWFETRVGMVTASRIADATAKLKNGGESAARRNYKLDLVVERLTGKPVEHFVSVPMQWGRDNESLARAAYEERTEQDVELVGFALHPSIEYAGASPDGLVGNDGMVQFKCPTTHTHIEYLLNDCVPEEHAPQMLWEMSCCPGRSWCDFVSFDPRLPKELQLFICRLKRDEARIAAMEAEAKVLLAEVEATIAKLKFGTEGLLRMSIARARAGLEISDSDIQAVAP